MKLVEKSEEEQQANVSVMSAIEQAKKAIREFDMDSPEAQAIKEDHDMLRLVKFLQGDENSPTLAASRGAQQLSPRSRAGFYTVCIFLPTKKM